jgi:hypothetical protein
VIGREKEEGQESCFLVDWSHLDAEIDEAAVLAVVGAAREIGTGGFGAPATPRPHTFLLARRPPTAGAQHVAYRSDARVLVVGAAPSGGFVHEHPVVSRQEILPAPEARVVSRAEWQKIHDALFRRKTEIMDAQGHVVASPSSVAADLPRVGAIGLHEAAFPHARLRLPGHEEIALGKLRFQYHLEDRPIMGTTLAEAFAHYAMTWMFGWSATRRVQRRAASGSSWVTRTSAPG